MEDHNLLEKMDVVPESQNISDIHSENVLDIKSYEVTTDNVYKENNQQNCEVQNISVVDIPLPQDTQSNGVPTSCKDEKPEEDLINLNHSVSQEFKNQVIECIEEVRLSAIEDSNDAEYLDVIDAGTTEVTVIEETLELQEICDTKTTSSACNQEPEEIIEQSEVQLTVEKENESVDAEKSKEESLKTAESTLESSPELEKNMQSEDVSSTNTPFGDKEQKQVPDTTERQVKEKSDSVSMTDSSATEVLSSEASEDTGESEVQDSEKDKIIGTESSKESTLENKDQPRNNGAEETLTEELNISDELRNLDSMEASISEDPQSTLSADKTVVSEKTRNVIQSIFDDWQDEALEEETAPKGPDSVEQELKNLLQDEKFSEGVEENPMLVKVQEKERKHEAKTHSSSTEKKSRPRIISVERKVASKSSSGPVADDAKNKSCAEIVASLKRDAPSTPKILSRSSRSVADKVEQKPKLQAMKSAIKGRLLTGQLTHRSPAMSEVITERLRVKPANLDPPGGVDVVFVKKLTQRLSHKLGAISSPSVPNLLSSSASETPKKQIEVADSSSPTKGTNCDRKELLAILEGDVDPDWSNLKSPQENKPEQGVASNKLDPSIEREMALKQLLELPGSLTKKKRKSTKSKEAEDKTEEEPKNEAEGKKTKVVTPTKSESKEEQSEKKIDGEELRSGRKRKPTEKAREHEQSFSNKRQKVMKGKTSPAKKREESPEDEGDPAETENVPLNDALTLAKNKDDVEDQATLKKPVSKQLAASNKDKSPKPKPETPTPVKQKAMLKKPAQVKSKVPGRKPGRPPNKPAVASKQKSREKKGKINEIERLLQDEGVVNLLYDVEQTDRKRRLIPITKSQTKVMDIEKVEREWNQRKKLVRNAVLSAQTSTAANVKPRPKRTSTGSATEKKAQESGKQKAVETVLAAKIANAAEDSVIFRRHSTSSYSSAPGSPRIFLHEPMETESVQEEAKNDDISLTKRFVKRKELAKKKQKLEVEESKDVLEEKCMDKKVPAKKRDKSQDQETLAVSSPKKGRKIMTRSNKMQIKDSPKSIKVEDLASDNEDEDQNQDELAVVLAETATALSSVSGNSQAGNASGTRKNRGNTNPKKSLDSKFDNLKTDSQHLFSNKEINVRRHGKLVQLILTPSSSSKLRNGISLQMMQEFRDVLSKLKKDVECTVVIVTSTGTSFCEGIEIGTLLHTDKEERRKCAEEMANGIKEFLKSLASFNKPIVAAVQGAAVGLGVTMLPLFDLVIASDKATFSTPCGELGHIAEGVSVISLTVKVGSLFANELLLGGRTMTANEALAAGLVTRVLWPDRFQIESLPSVKAMSDHSLQSMETTKSLLRRNLRQKLDEALELETEILIQHWCSAECQEAIKTYLDEKVQ